MNKKILIILGLVILFSFSFFLLIFYKTPSKTTGTPYISPTPSLPTSPIDTIAKTSINDGDVNVPLDKQITIDFTSPVDTSDFVVSFLPETNFTLQTSNNSLIIKPSTPLNPSTRYSIVVTTADKKTLVTSFTFTSFGPTPTLDPDTRPSGEPEKTDAVLKQSRPDIFLASQPPFPNPNFSISYSFRSSPTEQFVFLVTLRKDGTNEPKNIFFNWLKSLGLTEAQIALLEITYQ